MQIIYKPKYVFGFQPVEENGFLPLFFDVVEGSALGHKSRSAADTWGGGIDSFPHAAPGKTKTTPHFLFIYLPFYLTLQ